MTKSEEIYQRLPVIAQHFAVSVFGYYWRNLRFGSGYKQFLKDYLHRESFNIQDWTVWQNQRLQEVLISALSAPYYSRNWSKSQQESARTGKLNDLPLLEKEPLRIDPRSFLCSDQYPRRTQTFYTSGTTGTPIETIWTIPELRKSIALREARSARWAGVSFKLPRATFSGRMVEPDPHSNGPFYRYNLAERQVYFSPFHLKPDTAKEYVQALIKHKTRWMTGYAVSYYLLAKFILESGLQVPEGIQSLITTSEKTTPDMRKTMESAFNCRVYEEYSTVENVLFASECAEGKLHISPDAGIVEILRPDGSPCLPGEMGEVVATSLMRTYQPLIRFRLGDLAMWDLYPCPCGRQMPVIKEVIGRLEDVVVGPDGRQMVRFHGVFIDKPNIIEGQIIQEALDLIRVKIVPAKGFNEIDSQDIIDRIKHRLGNQVQVIVESVSTIPRTKTGKFQAVISNLKR